MTDLDVTQDGNLSNNTAPNLTDRILWIRNSDSSLMDITFDQLMKLINSLTADSSPDFDADYLMSYDASAGAPKKVILKTANRIIQVVGTQTGAVATGTTLIPFDDTIPQNTEGTQYMTQAITPTNANNLLQIDVVFVCAVNVLSSACVAIFQDTNANALACAFQTIPVANYTATISFRHTMVAGTTSATTFKVRAGQDVAGTLTFNGQAGGRIMGGVAASSMKIKEIKV